MHHRSMPRSRACWGENGKPWGGINSRYGGNEARTLTQKPVYGKSAWSRAPLPLTIPLQEFFIEKRAALAMPPDNLSGGLELFALPPAAVMADLTGTGTAALHDRAWDGEWDSRRWDDYIAHAAITTESEEEHVISNTH